MPAAVRPLYRLPWTTEDSIITWLEPTKNCNLACRGCYSRNVPGAHVPLREVQERISGLAKHVRADVLAIGGGEPLTHPRLPEIVRFAAAAGFKPFVNTNGLLADEPMLARLRDSGAAGLTFHVDSLQNRPGWSGRSEEELNALRQHFADLTARVGGLSCYFSMTAARENLGGVPAVLEWGRRNPEKAHLLLFITYREPSVPTAADSVTMDELLSQAALADPAFAPCGRAGGGRDPEAVKWLVALRVLGEGVVHGYLGAPFLRVFQNLWRRFRGRYPGQVAPAAQSAALLPLLLSFWDPGARQALRSAFGRRGAGLPRLAIQPVLFIQPQTLVRDAKPEFFS